MNRKLKYLFLLPMTAVVSCGYSTSYLVEGDRYNSPIFEKNYYTNWDYELKSATKRETIVVGDNKLITGIYYSVFSSNEIEGLGTIDPNFFDKDPDLEEYAAQYKMNSIDDSFNYGYQSKLFDGQMVCGGQNGRPEYAYQLGRVQTPESGFSARFSKESSDLHYVALQFKASCDNTKDCYLLDDTVTSPHGHTDSQLFHESVIDLTVTLYVKTYTGIVAQPLQVTIDMTGGIPVGYDIHGDPLYEYKTNNGHYYTFLAIDLEGYADMTRLIGVSVNFTVTEDELLRQNKEKGVDLSYALFLYEIFFPYTSWN